MEEVASHLFYLQEGQKYLLRTKYTASNNHTEPELGVLLPDDTKMLPIKQNLFFQDTPMQPQALKSQTNSTETTLPSKKKDVSLLSKDPRAEKVESRKTGKC